MKSLCLIYGTDRSYIRKAMPRPLEFDRDVALETAMQVFWAKGYEATSLQDLIDATGLSKSSFYQSFESKQELFQRCIRRYADQVVDDMQRQLREAPSGYDFIVNTLKGVAKAASRDDGQRGCLVMNTANEFAQRDPILAELIAKEHKRFEAAFLAAIERAQREGSIPKSKPARALARYCLTTLSGLKTMAKAGASARALREVAMIAVDALR